MPSNDLIDEIHFADAMERVTGGAATRLVRARWRARKLLITPTGRAEGMGGRPVTYSRVGLVEARLIHEAGQAGIDQTIIARAWRARIERLGDVLRVAEAGGKAVSGYLDDADVDVASFEAAVRSGQLVEFEERPTDPEDDWLWLVPYVRAPGGDVLDLQCIRVRKKHLQGAMIEVLDKGPLRRDTAVQFVVIKISAAVCCVDRALARK